MKKAMMILAVAIMAGSASMAMAQSIYSNSFEEVNGTPITNDVAWTAASDSEAYVTNITAYINTTNMNTPYMGAPFGGNPGVLSFANGLLSNNCSSAATNVVIDTMIQPSETTDLPYDEAVSNSQCSIAFTSTGIAVWHGVQTAPRQGADYAQWSVLNASSTPVSIGKWCRLTVTLNYKALPYDDIIEKWNAMFQVQIDGKPLTSPYGYQTADSSSGVTNGSWLCMAQAETPTQISSLILNGTGMMDDLNVTSGDPVGMITATHSIPYNWFVYKGVTNDTSVGAMTAAEADQADADGDGMWNWQEYLAGTEPTNETSKLVIISQTMSNNFPLIQWVGGSSPLADYTIAATTNLTSGWTNLALYAKGNVTNTYYVTNAPATSPGFLRVTVMK